MVEVNDEPKSSRMRNAHTISYKIDVCNYLIAVNGNITATAKYFEIRRKQVRYYRDRHELYQSMGSKGSKKNILKVSNSRNRAKYYVQEKKLFEWLIETREEGNFFCI